MKLDRKVSLIAAGLLLAFSGGCHRELLRLGSKTPIGQVQLLFQVSPWLNADKDQDEKPEGIQFRIILIPQNGAKGVHRDGTIEVKMFRKSRNDAGEPVRKLVDSWTYPTSALVKSKKPQVIGDYYLMQMYWYPHDVLGQDVELVVTYKDPQSKRRVAATSKTIFIPKEVF